MALTEVVKQLKFKVQLLQTMNNEVELPIIVCGQSGSNLAIQQKDNQ